MNDTNFYCDMTALSTDHRARYQEFEKLFSDKIKSISEIPNGYTLSFSMNPDNFILAAEFVTFERLCCPFLSFSMNVTSGEELGQLSITGPEGSKQFIQAELGLTPQTPA